jgi:hypothetical protein
MSFFNLKRMLISQETGYKMNKENDMGKHIGLVRQPGWLSEKSRSFTAYGLKS